ncbi:hypothetical protein HYPSUDRAFT_219214 [Hypholoma sublateritium FD-334 SS-4]|uniref:PARP catalytic domain-containing protein n=1 Tax=Hypholoma sublateritium (strain FD-334 SS-4) TaxID=945553 RepID=A0A0D2NCS8_HYPSF|nr:hypothetical protein HYPSUDRAFT_219214 [Hypholoma sublateritium FD-334 SS-4]
MSYNPYCVYPDPYYVYPNPYYVFPHPYYGYTGSYHEYPQLVPILPVPISSNNLLHSGPNEYEIISERFLNGWLHPDKPTPTIKQIFLVAHSTREGHTYARNFNDYYNRVGNMQMLFHGTRCECRIGRGSLKACDSETCNLCEIIKGSYSMEKAKGQQMFGRGIYTTEVSSKADVYVDNVDDSQDSIMILNQVALGRSKIMYEACHNMQAAPPTYDSVTAATYAHGGEVRYHEAVVYREDAICPHAIVVYS